MRKIKHFANYGTVKAGLVSREITNNAVELHIKVQGNHEMGIERNDPYDIANWLINRFDKVFAEKHCYRDITSVNTQCSYENGEEVCDYHITYKL